MTTLRLDIWSDIACPWCYVGKRRLEKALQRFEHRDAVEVVWRSFELDPAAPPVRESSGAYVERLARKYGATLEQAQAMIDRMVATAAAEGIEMVFERIQPGNTFDAHRLLHFARQRNVQNRLKERLMRAYLSEGVAIGDPHELIRLAADVGLDADEARGVITTDAFAEAVRADEDRAAALGIHGVPCFVVGERFGISGAQSPDVLLSLLTRGWAEIDPAQELGADGPVCGPTGCSDPRETVEVS